MLFDAADVMHAGQPVQYVRSIKKMPEQVGQGEVPICGSKRIRKALPPFINLHASLFLSLATTILCGLSRMIRSCET